MDHKENLSTEIEFSPSISHRVKSGFSDLLFNSARIFAEKSQALENTEKALEWPQPSHRQNYGYATAAVIMSAAAMEASINEIYDRAVDKRYTEFPSLKKAQVDLLAQLWPVVEMSTVLKKHDVALSAAGLRIIEPGCEPSQSAAALIALRDTIMHYKPEWDDQLKKLKSLEDRLTGKFPLNQLTDNLSGHMLWFPGRCLGAGCAKWACDAAYNYHIAFVNSLGIKSHLPKG